MDKEYFMKEALKEAEKAYEIDEVPIGAVVVCDEKIVGRGHNTRETAKDPTAHAEVNAIREAAASLGGWRLHRCDIYVTVEPCPMCAGAITTARIKNLYIGTADAKGGACGSVMDIPRNEKLNHQVNIEYGVLEEECREILQKFFSKLREMRKSR